MSELYALRAGLSAITLEKDEADEVYETYEPKRKELEQNSAKSIDEHSKLCGRVEELREEQSQSKYFGTRFEELSVILGKRLRKSERRETACAILFPIFLVVLGIAALETLCAIFLLSGWLLVLVISAFIIWGGLTRMLFLFKEDSYNGDKFKKYVSKHHKEYLDIVDDFTQKFFWSIEKNNNGFMIEKQEFEGEMSELSELEVKLKMCEEARDKAESELKNCLYMIKTDQVIEQHITMGQMIYRGLQEQFSNLLDERDWENVDLVIYVLETGRADSMKEALQQVDHERRTERIIEAIDDAARSISDSIQSGLRALAYTMTQCFSALSRQIDDVHTTLKTQNERLGSLSEHVHELTSSTQLMNALQAKSCETSLALMQDVKALRDHSDYADWRLRSGY